MPRLSQATIQAPRFIRCSDVSEFLIYTDGACSNNGANDGRGGCAFVFRPETSPSMIPPTTSSGHSTASMKLHQLGASKFRLESRGPTGEAVPQTSNRAELRAVIAALGYRLWNNEGCRRLVIATDSAYVVDGCTAWITKWMRNGWQTSTHQPVKNQDLWLELIRLRDKWSKAGVKVLFWRIPRSRNTLADRLAKEATALEEDEYWADRRGTMC